MSLNYFFSQVSQYEALLSQAPLVVMDGNIHHSAVTYIADVCHNSHVPGRTDLSLPFQVCSI